MLLLRAETSLGVEVLDDFSEDIARVCFHHEVFSPLSALPPFSLLHRETAHSSLWAEAQEGSQALSAGGERGELSSSPTEARPGSLPCARPPGHVTTRGPVGWCQVIVESTDPQDSPGWSPVAAGCSRHPREGMPRTGCQTRRWLPPGLRGPSGKVRAWRGSHSSPASTSCFQSGHLETGLPGPPASMPGPT